jgi:HD-GYP domain-containing protein (c-di-GMP phosphodiesterase class II)
MRPGALQAIDVYFRNNVMDGDVETRFTLYRGADALFTAEDRQRMLESGREFVYIRFADQARYRDQTERAVAQAVSDPNLALAEKAQIVYETTVEVVNELLADPNVATHSKQIEGLSRSISALVLKDTGAFRQLFAVSHHDFYTATHMVNVATWMVPLAYALGYRRPEQLTLVCQAGLLHDIGKIFVPEPVLNHRGKLAPEQWDVIRRHPEQGWAHLKAQGDLPADVLTVCRQHHERLNGRGYPDGLIANQIHDLAKIAAVVDSFDAMTALRPYKEHTLTVSDAVMELRARTPECYDREVVEAWLGMLRDVNDADLPVGVVGPGVRATFGQDERRRNRRYPCECRATLTAAAESGKEGAAAGPEIDVTVHNISRFGLGLLSSEPLELGALVRANVSVNSNGGRIVQGRVVRCRAYPDGVFEIGVDLQPGGAKGPEQ